jgi:hypothetical protein
LKYVRASGEAGSIYLEFVVPVRAKVAVCGKIGKLTTPGTDEIRLHVIVWGW